jgi:hypothetical protein
MARFKKGISGNKSTQFNKGYIPWNKGIKRTQEEKEKIREACRNCPVVHHINGNHFDDRLENRMILTPREHTIIHMMQGDIHIFKKGNKYASKGGL